MPSPSGSRRSGQRCRSDCANATARAAAFGVGVPHPGNSKTRTYVPLPWLTRCTRRHDTDDLAGRTTRPDSPLTRGLPRRSRMTSPARWQAPPRAVSPPARLRCLDAGLPLLLRSSPLFEGADRGKREGRSNQRLLHLWTLLEAYAKFHDMSVYPLTGTGFFCPTLTSCRIVSTGLNRIPCLRGNPPERHPALDGSGLLAGIVGCGE